MQSNCPHTTHTYTSVPIQSKGSHTTHTHLDTCPCMPKRPGTTRTWQSFRNAAFSSRRECPVVVASSARACADASSLPKFSSRFSVSCRRSATHAKQYRDTENTIDTANQPCRVHLKPLTTHMRDVPPPNLAGCSAFIAIAPRIAQLRFIQTIASTRGYTLQVFWVSDCAYSKLRLQSPSPISCSTVCHGQACQPLETQFFTVTHTLRKDECEQGTSTGGVHLHAATTRRPNC